MSNSGGPQRMSSDNPLDQDTTTENSLATTQLHHKPQEKPSDNLFSANAPSTIPNVNISSNYNDNDVVVVNQEGSEENSTPPAEQSCESGESPTNTPPDVTPTPHVIMGADRYRQDMSQDLLTAVSANNLLQTHSTQPVVASQRGLSSIPDIPDEATTMLEEDERRSREFIMGNEHENRSHYLRSYAQIILLKQEKLARQRIEQDYATQLHMLYDGMVYEEDILLEDEIREIGLQELREEEEKERQRQEREGNPGMKMNFFTRSGETPPFHEGTEDSDDEEVLVNSATSHVDPNSSNSFTNRKTTEMSPVDDSNVDVEIHPDDDPAVVLAKLQRKYRPLMPRGGAGRNSSQISDVKPSSKAESKRDSGSGSGTDSTSTEDNTPLEMEVIAEGAKRDVGKGKKGDEPTWEEQGAERQEPPAELESPMKPETLDGGSKRRHMRPSASNHPMHEEYQPEREEDEPNEMALESDIIQRVPKSSTGERREEELEQQISSPSHEIEKKDRKDYTVGEERRHSSRDVRDSKRVETTARKVVDIQRDVKRNIISPSSTTSVNKDKIHLSNKEVVRSDISSSSEEDEEDLMSPLQPHLGEKENIYSAHRSRKVDKEAMEQRAEAEDEEEIEKPFEYSLSLPQEKLVRGSKRRQRDDVVTELRNSDDSSVDQDESPLNTSVVRQGGKVRNNRLSHIMPSAEIQGFGEDSEVDEEAPVQSSMIQLGKKPGSRKHQTKDPSAEMQEFSESSEVDEEDVVQSSTVQLGKKPESRKHQTKDPSAEMQEFSKSSEVDEEDVVQSSTVQLGKKPGSGKQPTKTFSGDLRKSGDSLSSDHDHISPQVISTGSPISSIPREKGGRDAFQEKKDEHINQFHKFRDLNTIPIPSRSDLSTDEETEEEPLSFHIIHEGGRSTMGVAKGEPPAEHTSYRSSDPEEDSDSSNPFDTPMSVGIIHNNVTRVRSVSSRGPIEASESCNLEESQEESMELPLQPGLLLGNGRRQIQSGTAKERSAAFEELSEHTEDEDQDMSILPNIGNRRGRDTPHISSKGGPIAESGVEESSEIPSEEEPMDTRLVYPPSGTHGKARRAPSPNALETGSSSESLEGDVVPLDGITGPPNKRVHAGATKHRELVHSMEEEEEDTSEEEQPLGHEFSPQKRGSAHRAKSKTAIVEEAMTEETEEQETDEEPLEVQITKPTPKHRQTSTRKEIEENWFQGSSDDTTDEENPQPTQVGKGFPRHRELPPNKTFVTSESYGSQLSIEPDDSQLDVAMNCIRPDKRKGTSGDAEVEWEGDTNPSFSIRAGEEVLLIQLDNEQESEKQAVLTQEEETKQEPSCVTVTPREIVSSKPQQPIPIEAQTTEENAVEISIQKTKTKELQSFELHDPTEIVYTLQENSEPQSVNLIHLSEGIIDVNESEKPSEKLAGLYKDADVARSVEKKETDEREICDMELDETELRVTTLREEEEEGSTETTGVVDAQEHKLAPRDVHDRD
ncbi:uncharacterized protein TM35_000181490, partial [Trypanosoma theileri]